MSKVLELIYEKSLDKYPPARQIIANSAFNEGAKLAIEILLKDFKFEIEDFAQGTWPRQQGHALFAAKTANDVLLNYLKGKL